MIKLSKIIENENFESFLNQLIHFNTGKNSAYIDIIKNACNIISQICENTIVHVSIINNKRQNLNAFCWTGETDWKDYNLILDPFDTSNPYTNVTISNKIDWFKVDNLEDSFSMKPYLVEKNVKEAYFSPLHHGDKIFGCLNVFLLPMYKIPDSEKLHKIIENVVQVICFILDSWYQSSSFSLKEIRFDLIKQLTQWQTGAQKLHTFLLNFINDLTNSTKLAAIGLFLNDEDNKFVAHSKHFPNEALNFFCSCTNITSLSFYNIVSKVEEDELKDTNLNYGIVLPIGKSGSSLGAVVCFDASVEIFDNSLLDLLTLVTDLLFLIIKSEKTLEDVQEITLDKELFSFPVLIVNKGLETIYLNRQAEKMFDKESHLCIGQSIEHIVQFREDQKEQVYSAIGYTLKNYKKETLQTYIYSSIYTAKHSEEEYRTIFLEIAPSVNNLTGENCAILTFVDTTESAKLEHIKEEYAIRSKMYLNVLTHDIYNILFGISGYSQLISTVVPDNEKKLLERIDTLILKGTSIIRDIRVLTKIFNAAVDKGLYLAPLRAVINSAFEQFKADNSFIDITVLNNISPKVKIVGGEFVETFFVYLAYSLSRYQINTKLDVVFDGKSDPEKSIYQIIVTQKNTVDDAIIKEIQTAWVQQLPEHTLSKYLCLMILKEIAKKYHFNISIVKDEFDDSVNGTKLLIEVPIEKKEKKDKEIKDE